MRNRILGALLLAAAAALVARLWHKEPEPGTAGPPETARQAEAAGALTAENADGPGGPERVPERAAQAVEAAAQQGWTVEGRCVTLPEAGPIPGCSVKTWLVREPREPEWKADERTTTTGPDGRFRFTLAGNESASSVLCSSGGRAPASVSFQRPPGAAAVDLGDVPLRLGTKLRVRVVEDTGRPVANASVQVGPLRDARTPAGAGFAVVAYSGHVRSDRNGHVDFPYLKCAGRWRVYVVADGFEFHGPDVLEIPEGRATFDAELVVLAAPQADTVAGRAVDLAGQPLNGVHIAASPAAGSGNVTTRSRDDGSFRFRNLRRLDVGEQFRIGLASQERGHELVAEPPVVALGTTDLELRVRALRDFDLELVVTRGDTGAPVERYGCRVFEDPWSYVLPDHHKNYAEAKPEPHPEGRMRVSGVRKGRYRVSVWPAAAELAPLTFLPFDVPDGGPMPLHVVLHPWASLRVRLRTRAGQPVAGSAVQLRQLIGKSADGFSLTTHTLTLAQRKRGDWGTTMQVILEEGTSDAAGEVVLRGPAGQPMLAIAALGPGHLPCLDKPLALSHGTNERDLVVAADAEIRGKLGPPEFLTFCRGQSRTPEKTPALLLRSDTDRSSIAVSRTWPVAADGSFAIHGVPPGEWRLLVQLSLNRISSAQVPVQQLQLAGGEKRELAIDCAALMPGRLSALVRVDGKPLANGVAGFAQRTDGPRHWLAATTDGQGRLTAWLLEGTWLPSANVEDASGMHHSFFGNQWLEIRQGVTLEAVIELGRTGLELQLADEAGEPFANQIVWLRSREAGVTEQARTDERGKASVKSLPPGTVDLLFRLPEDDRQPADAIGTIPPARGGGAIELKLRVPRAALRR